MLPLDSIAPQLQCYPTVKRIYKEAATGTKLQGRKELDRLLSSIQPGDTVIFDSVSRMSRNADEGSALYEQLFQQSVNLMFLKEPHINTDVYKQAIERREVDDLHQRTKEGIETVTAQ